MTYSVISLPYSVIGITFTVWTQFRFCLSVLGESEGYTVKSKEKDIPISDYPLLQTEFLYASKKGKAEIEWEFPVILIDFSSDVFSV